MALRAIGLGTIATLMACAAFAEAPVRAPAPEPPPRAAAARAAPREAPPPPAATVRLASPAIAILGAPAEARTTAALASAAGRAAPYAPRPIGRPERGDQRAVGATGPAAAAATIVDAMPLDETVLIGVIGRGDSRFALLRTPDGAMRRVERGGVVQGWTVLDIADDSVRMRNPEGRTRQLDFP